MCTHSIYICILYIYSIYSLCYTLCVYCSMQMLHILILWIQRVYIPVYIILFALVFTPPPSLGDTEFMSAVCVCVCVSNGYSFLYNIYTVHTQILCVEYTYIMMRSIIAHASSHHILCSYGDVCVHTHTEQRERCRTASGSKKRDIMSNPRILFSDILTDGLPDKKWYLKPKGV